MLAKDASEKDILESKQRLRRRQDQLKFDRDAKQAIDIVNRHSNKIKGFRNEEVDTSNASKKV